MKPALPGMKHLKQVVKKVLSLSKKYKATSAEVIATISDGYSINVRMGEVETVEYNNDKGLGITIYFGKQKASVTTSDMSVKSLEKVVQTACNIAKFTEKDNGCGLADAHLMAKDFLDLDIYHPWIFEPKQAIQLGLECEAYALGLDKRINNSEGVSISTHQMFSVYGNSHGFIGDTAATKHYIGCELIAEQNKKKERDYGYTVSCDALELDSIQDVAKETARRTLRRLRSRKLATQKAPVIFEANVARTLISNFMAAIHGNNLYQKNSFLVDALGKQIFSKHLRIYETPHLLKSLNSSVFDSEGVATKPKDFITQGILKNYMLNSYSARKLGMQTTANSGGVFNLWVESTQDDINFSQLLKKMDRGIIVTELIGQGVNLVTGDYSRGAAGLWVEHGEIQYPVSEITIAGNLKEMFAQIIDVADDIEMRGNIKTGSILLESLSIAGK